jgi:hypothetical protein
VEADSMQKMRESGSAIHLSGTMLPQSPPMLTRWLFENPWPLAIALALVGAVLLVRWLGDRSRPLLAGGGVAIVLAVAALLVGGVVTTPGEHAEAVVRRLVGHAERAETDAAVALFAEGAVLNYGRRENPGTAIEDIRRALSALEGRHRIESNRVRRLAAVTLDEETGEVELSCSTTTSSSSQAVPTDWIVRVRRIDGEWRIDRLTFERLFMNPPTPGVWR